MAEVNTSTVEVNASTVEANTSTVDIENAASGSPDTSSPDIIKDWSNPTYEWVEANIDVANCCVTLEDSIVKEIETSGFKNYFDFDSREQKSDGIYASGADKGGYSECVGLPVSKAINTIIYSTSPRTTSKYYIVPEDSTKTSFIKTVKEKYPNPADNVDKYAEMLGKEIADTISDNDFIPWLFHEWCLKSYHKRTEYSDNATTSWIYGERNYKIKIGKYIPELLGDGTKTIKYVSYVNPDNNIKFYSYCKTSYDPLFTTGGINKNPRYIYNNPKRLFYFGDAFVDIVIDREEFRSQIFSSLEDYGEFIDGQKKTVYRVSTPFIRIKETIPYYSDDLTPEKQILEYFNYARGSNAFNMHIDSTTYQTWCKDVLSHFCLRIKKILFQSVVNQYTPICIDSRVGNYVTFDTICSIIEKALEYFRNNLPEKLLLLNSGRKFKDAGLGNGASVKGKEADRCWNIYDYADAFANMRRALFEKFTTFEKVNHAAILNFIADNLLVVHKEEVNEVVEEEIELTGDESLDTRSRRLAQRQKLSNEYNTSDKDLRIDMRNKATGDSNSNCVYYLSDYNWSMNEKALNKMGLKPADFPYIRVYELQPDRRVSFKKIADNIAGVVDQASNWLLGTAGTIVTALVNKLGATTAEAQAYSSNTKWVDDLLAGDWVGQYDIPYFGNDFFKSSSSSGWSMGNLLEKSDFLKNSLTMNVQDIPTWQYTPGEGQTLTCPIVLVNETIEDFIKNLKFLYSFTMGSFWLQESFLRYRSPNLYRLICPGRFVYLYAALDVSAEYLGKIKRYSTADAKRFFGEDDSAFENFKPLKRYITGMDTCNIPEAFKVSATFKNLTPNAFNIINGYMTVSESAQNIIPNITTRASGSSYFVDTAIDTVKNLVSGDHTSLTSQEAIASRLTGKSAEEIEELKKSDPEIAKMINDQKVKEEAERKKQEAQQEQKG